MDLSETLYVVHYDSKGQYRPGSKKVNYPLPHPYSSEGPKRGDLLGRSLGLQTDPYSERDSRKEGDRIGVRGPTEVLQKRPKSMRNERESSGSDSGDDGDKGTTETHLSLSRPSNVIYVLVDHHVGKT